MGRKLGSLFLPSFNSSNFIFFEIHINFLQEHETPFVSRFQYT
jgi:hypothetical protein